ncbi:MAG: sigma-70 family RNA polymerase sigma factor [Pirellulales bacterium]|nr:sigma-70 family RNA polymerase sigma factor [Pirellulales bacterium]
MSHIEQPSIDESIVRARSNADALGVLLEQYRPLLQLRAEQELGPRLRQRFDASDLVQETLFTASTRFSQFRGCSEPEMSAWVFAIFRNAACNLVRDHVHSEKRGVKKEKHLYRGEDTFTLSWSEPVADQTAPIQRLIRGEQAIRLAQLICELPEDQRKAVTYRYIEQREIVDIANELGRSYAAVANLIRRGVQSLRQKTSDASWG